MSQDMTPLPPENVGRTTRIVVGALMAGLMSFGVVAFLVSQKSDGEPSVVSYVALLFFVITIFVSIVISQTSSSLAIKRIAAGRPQEWRAELAPVYASKTILSNAPLEGAGFFNCIAYIIDGHWM